MVHNDRDPLTIHDFKATDAFKAFVAFLKGVENLISVASAIPATLLVQMARVL